MPDGPASVPKHDVPGCDRRAAVRFVVRGRLSCIDAATGEIVYEETLDLGKGDVFASIVLAGNYLMTTHENGTTIVFEPGREYVEVAKNQLGDMVRSTPVFDGDRMYVRGYDNLYCIGPTDG
jgi:outer membrane protein assembly factor BamB